MIAYKDVKSILNNHKKSEVCFLMIIPYILTTAAASNAFIVMAGRQIRRKPCPKIIIKKMPSLFLIGNLPIAKKGRMSLPEI